MQLRNSAIKTQNPCDINLSRRGGCDIVMTQQIDYQIKIVQKNVKMRQ